MLDTTSMSPPTDYDDTFLHPLNEQSQQARNFITHFQKNLDKFFTESNGRHGEAHWLALRERVLEVCKGERDGEVVAALLGNVDEEAVVEDEEGGEKQMAEEDSDAQAGGSAGATAAA